MPMQPLGPRFEKAPGESVRWSVAQGPPLSTRRSLTDADWELESRHRVVRAAEWQLPRPRLLYAAPRP